MNQYEQKNLMPDAMSDITFSRFSSFVQAELGIKMPAAKKTMLQARLSKRLRKLGINSFDEYYDYVFSPEGIASELPNMINMVTTNKTDFFREPWHFEYLMNKALPELLNGDHTRRRREFMVWSAGCSTGNEPYTIAMVLNDFASRCPGFRYSILATDLSTKALQEAARGIYDEADVAPVPFEMKKRYLLRSKNKSERRVKITPELRAKVKFRRLNFADEDYGLRRERDVVFCRNVIIYFDKPTQETVLNRICRHLNPGGYLFMGHSETLNGLDVPLMQVAPTIYRKTL